MMPISTGSRQLEYAFDAASTARYTDGGAAGYPAREFAP
jgi:hypothetical protein